MILAYLCIKQKFRIEISFSSGRFFILYTPYIFFSIIPLHSPNQDDREWQTFILIREGFSSSIQ